MRQLHNYILVTSLGIKRASLSDILTQLAVSITDIIQLLHGVRYEVTALRIKYKAKTGLSIEQWQ